ncbi:MAG: sulfatase [Phycisphaeraceae bacterium]
MRAIMLMFDSLNRHLLPPYNEQTPVHAPNFRRLAQRSVTFDRSYVCSMPCMPARRDLHTSRPNFLHRGWGPLEPFDDSMPQMLSKAGIYSHLVTDHYHYFEDGGCTYHNRYNSWQFFRGQEGDPHVGQIADPPIPENLNPKGRREDWINRQFQQREQDLPQSLTLDAGCDFLDRNADQDNWFVQIECFDPHEPFVSHRKYQDLYPNDYTGPLFDWPGYREVSETPEQVEAVRRNYAALVSKCDASLGDVLDRMDRHNLWDDTLLIVWTDHGFLLGEHNCWAKNWMPLYEEVSHTPFFLYDPRQLDTAGQRREALVQPALDLAPTLLRYFGQQPTPDMLGHDLGPVVERDQPVRDAAIFGYHGNRLNITDGRHVCYHQAVTENNDPLYEYTLVPTRMRGYVDRETLAHATLADPFTFTKGERTLRLGRAGSNKPKVKASAADDHLLFDLDADPQQQTPLRDDAVHQRLLEQAAALMHACDAPPEQYIRLGIPQPTAVASA